MQKKKHILLKEMAEIIKMISKMTWSITRMCIIQGSKVLINLVPRVSLSHNQRVTSVEDSGNRLDHTVNI